MDGQHGARPGATNADDAAGETHPPGQAGQQALQQAPGRRGPAFQVTTPNNAAGGVAGVAGGAAGGAHPGRGTPPGQRQRHHHHHPHHHHDGRHRPDGRQSSPPGPAGPQPNPFRLHRSTHFRASPRLSMPLASDDSGSEPDLSLLGMARGGDDPEARFNAIAYGEAGGEDDDEILSQAHYGIEDTSIEEQVEEQDTAPLLDPATIGLKEISNLGKFTVSSHKPSCGVDELQKDDLKLCWQSDGPQPHKLTVYFAKRVGIRDIRFFVNYGEDESYTPSKIVFKSGTSENNLIEFATMILECPVGWQQVPIKGAGGEPDGNTLVSYVLQMQILENHQNGKDTHLRGFKIYAFDVEAAHGAGRESSVAGDDLGLAGQEGSGDRLGDIVRSLAAARLDSGGSGFTMPDFMREPEIR